MQDIDRYLDTMIREGLYSNRKNLCFRLDMLFGGIDFKNKRVLDIGGGHGLYSFYAACRGAKTVVCLEPEAEGSFSGVVEKFHKLQGLLKCDNARMVPVTFQAFESGGATFDVILLHNSINHLDEAACIGLLADAGSRAAYQEIFAKIASLSNKGARLIIHDCSRYNLFALLGLRNPLVPNVEWHKHQSPEVWANMLTDAGFANPTIRWPSFSTLGHWGRILLGNKIMAFCLTSHFCLTMDKV